MPSPSGDPYGDMIRGLLMARMKRPDMERARAGLFANLPEDQPMAIEELPSRAYSEEPVDYDPFAEPAYDELPPRRPAALDPEIFRRRRPVLDPE